MLTKNLLSFRKYNGNFQTISDVLFTIMQKVYTKGITIPILYMKKLRVGLDK